MHFWLVTMIEYNSNDSEVSLEDVDHNQKTVFITQQLSSVVK